MARRKTPPFWTLAAAVAILAACSSDEDARPLPCPSIFALPDAAYQVAFDGEGRDLTDVLFEADLQAAGISCSYDDNMLEVEMQVQIEALLGPANLERKADIHYFVAVTRADRSILSRDNFVLTIPFEGNRTRVRASEELEPRIPLDPGETGANYQIYVGFALSEDQLEYNRANR